MNQRDLANLMGKAIAKYLDPASTEPIYVYGIKIVGVDRDIFRNITNFEFENGWLIPIQIDEYYRDGGPDAVYRALVRAVENWLQFLDPMELQAFRAPEVLVDEDPEELDPFPVFVCDCCRNDYNRY